METTEKLTERAQAFLERLTELSLETGITITGCQRCGAPRLRVDERSHTRGSYRVERIAGSERLETPGPIAHGFECESCQDLDLADADNLPEPPCEFLYLRWRPELIFPRGEGRAGLDGTPWVLPPSDGRITGTVDEV